MLLLDDLLDANGWIVDELDDPAAEQHAHAMAGRVLVVPAFQQSAADAPPRVFVLDDVSENGQWTIGELVQEFAQAHTQNAAAAIVFASNAQQTSTQPHFWVIDDLFENGELVVDALDEPIQQS